MESTAWVSEDGLYRYDLTRRWSPGPLLPFVMLNPSTADARVDDPTIRRCMGFARRVECAGIRVVNLFAFRATSPRDLTNAADPVGESNDAAIRDAMRSSGVVVCGWGGWKSRDLMAGRVVAFSDLAYEEGSDLRCFGMTRDGSPRHPLYLKADAPMVRWP